MEGHDDPSPLRLVARGRFIGMGGLNQQDSSDPPPQGSLPEAISSAWATFSQQEPSDLRCLFCP